MRLMAITRSKIASPKLAHSAFPRITVRTPSKETQAVPKAAAIDVSAGDLADHLWRHGAPDKIPLSRPSAGPRHTTLTETRLAPMLAQPARDIPTLGGG